MTAAVPLQALAAAQAVARAHGVACDDAVLLAAGSNVLVHLQPSPVVARVMTGTAVLHDDLERWLGREVAVGSFLAERCSGVAVPPSDLIPPGPYEQDGFWMTMWQFVEHDKDAPAPRAHEVGRSLRGLHDALADFRGDLPPLRGIRDWLEGLLPPAETDLRDRLEALTPAVFESGLPAQAIHGDASLSNLLRTDRGLMWNDFEDVCLGPPAWDVAGLLHGRDAAFAQELLAAYGDPGVEDLEPFVEAHALYATIWQSFA